MSQRTATTIRFLTPSTGEVLRCGKGTQRAASHQTNFITSEYVMLYIPQGSATYSDDQHENVPIKAGDVWQRFPNIAHSIVCHEVCTWYFVAVPAAVIPLLEVTGIDPYKQISFHIGIHKQIMRRYEQVHRQLYNGKQSQLPNCLLAMQQLMIDLHQLAKSPDNAQQHWLELAKQQLGNALDQRIPTNQIAQSLGMSYANFRKKFTQATGNSPGQFRIRQRLQFAQEQLAGTQQSIADIAESLGYPDVYSFNAQFARHMGIPPGQYRKQWQWDSNKPEKKARRNDRRSCE